jgi:hypothetical protein
MKLFRRHKWDDDEPPGFLVGVHPSEFGIIIVALVIAVSFVYLILTPQDWEAFDRALIPASAKPTAQASHPGETEMILFGAKPAPTAKETPANREAAK